MSKIKLNDISMYYEVHGHGEPIVFIAGFSADHTTWNEVIHRFKDIYQIILFDNRGAGQTDAPQGPYSIEDMTNDVVALCAKLKISKAHFIGSSMGGFIVQTLVDLHPELIKSATICNSGATIHTCFHLYLRAQLELIKTGAPLATLIKASCSWVFSHQFLSQPGVLELLIQLGLDNPYPFSIQGYEGQYAALDRFDSKKFTHKVHVPTLVLAGDKDLIFSEESVKLLADNIPHSEYYCFTECGHLPHIECPEQFTKIVQEFISRVPGEAG